jgi:integrase/recombinase XerD
MKRAKVITPTQIAAVLNAAAQSRDPLRDRLLVGFTFYTGCRIGEAASLQYDDVLDASGKPSTHVRFRTSKRASGELRLIRIHPALMLLEEAYLAVRATRSGPLFRDQYGEPLSRGGAQKQASLLYQRAGLQGCSSHSARRTFITHNARRVGNGISLRDLQKIVGHRCLKTTEAYIEPSDREDEFLLNMYDDLPAAALLVPPSTLEIRHPVSAKRVFGTAQTRSNEEREWTERSGAAWLEWEEIARERIFAGRSAVGGAATRGIRRIWSAIKGAAGSNSRRETP